MPKTVIVVVILIIIVILLAAAAVFFKPFGPSGAKKTLTVGGAVFEVEVAADAVSRMNGLSGRPSLGEKEGLFFIFPEAGMHGFWMKDMNFPIDIVWINENKIVGFSENLLPEPDRTVFTLPIYYPPSEANTVLEINAGAVSKYNLRIGDAVNLE